MSASVHAGMPYPPGWRAPPPGWRTPPWMENPPRWRTPPGWRTPPQDGDPPGWRPPLDGEPPRMETPPGSRLQHTVYERPVRILLECILVFSALTLQDEYLYRVFMASPPIMPSLHLTFWQHLLTTLSLAPCPVSVQFMYNCLEYITGGSKGGGRQGRVLPLGIQILSFSCSFFGKKRLAHPLWELAPP